MVEGVDHVYGPKEGSGSDQLVEFDVTGVIGAASIQEAAVLEGALGIHQAKMLAQIPGERLRQLLEGHRLSSRANQLDESFA